MKFTSYLPALAVILSSCLLAAQNNGWNDDAQKCKDLSGDDAIAACTRAIGSGQLTQDNLATSYYNRAYEYRAKEEYDAAIADDSQAIQLNPAMTTAYNNRGLAYFDKGEYDRAIPDLEKALQLDPKHVNAFLNLGNAYKGEGDYTKALDDYNQALGIDPNNINAFIGRGNDFLAQGEIDPAIADFKSAARTQPANMYAALFLAAAELRKGDSGVVDELTEESKAVSTGWPSQIVQYYLGKTSEEDMAQAAKDPDAKQQRGRFCDLYFFLGEWQIFHAQQVKGIESLKRANDECQPSYYQNDLVHSELKRLGQ